MQKDSCCWVLSTSWIEPAQLPSAIRSDLISFVCSLFSGFYCKGRTRTARPVDRVTGDLCPEGHFCPAGSVMPSLCRDGEYSALTGQEEEEEMPLRHGLQNSRPLGQIRVNKVHEIVFYFQANADPACFHLSFSLPSLWQSPNPFPMIF